MTPDTASRAHNPMLLLFIAVAAQTMVGSDFSLASVAMPSMERGMGLGPALSQWVLTVYIIAYAGVLIVGGRLTDIFGQKAMLRAGLVMFLAGSAVTSMSPGLPLLLVGRCLQGIGGGLIYPSAFSTLTLAFPSGPKRFRAYTINMASQAVGAPLLTIVAGWSIGQFGWRTSFLLNVPVCVLLLVLLTRIGAVGARSNDARTTRIPYLNAVVLASAMASLIYALSSFTAKSEELRAAAPSALAVALALVVLFIVAEKRSSAPLISPALFRTKNFFAAIGLLSMIVIVGKGIIVLSNISFQKAIGFSALQASYALLPMSVASLLLIPLAPVSNRFVLPFPKRSLAAVFLFLATLYLILSQVPLSMAAGVLLLFVFLAPFATLTGVNMSLNEGLKVIPAEQQGVATAIMYTASQMVSAVGMSLLVAAPGLSTAADPFARFAPSFYVGAAYCFIGIVIAALFLKSAKSNEGGALPAGRTEP
ncbi:MFS transporter [Sphingobium sp. AN641]|uniref:MFS transporter n=1 Tax=Sphingobium sp. AN641 TaxID=3133443 RepID=UPI0030BCEDF4